MESRAALISIHPEHVERIFSGAKKLEFRRRWTSRSVETLFIYATAPVQRIIGFAKIVRVTQGTPTQLWRLRRGIEGGITKRKLFTYLNGSRKAVAIELKKITLVPGGVDPRLCLGRDFRPPQSFKYLSEREVSHINSAGGS
jgi:predicted transcriptional regulator